MSSVKFRKCGTGDLVRKSTEFIHVTILLARIPDASQDDDTSTHLAVDPNNRPEQYLQSTQF